LEKRVTTKPTDPIDPRHETVTPVIALANIAMVGVPAAYASTRSITITAIAALTAIAIVLAHTVGRRR
jgi:hypothetical protein